LALPAAAAAVLFTGYPGPPGQAQAVRAATVALGPPPADAAGPVVSCSGMCGVADRPDDPVVAYDFDPDRTDLVSIRYPTPTEDPDAMVRRAHERLTAAGWRTVHPLRRQVDAWNTCTQPQCSKPKIWTTFTASRDGLDITVGGNRERDAFADVHLYASVSKSASPTAMATVFAGLAGGMLGGWLIGVWATQRWRRVSLRRRTVLVSVAAPGLGVGTLMFLSTTNVAIYTVINGGTAKDVQIPAFVLSLLPPVTWLPALSLVAMVGIAALPDRGGDRRNAAAAAPRRPAPN
jgi:hypothetical protein